MFSVMAVNIGFENAKKKKLEEIVDDAAEPSFAVPQLPSAVVSINVSNKEGVDRG